MPHGEADTAIVAFNGFRIEDPDSLLSIRLENPFLTGVAKNIEATGLCSLQDAYLCIIPALSSAKLLSVQEVIDFVRGKAKDAELLGQWDIVAPVYLRLFQDSKSWGASNHFFLRATAVLIETFLSIFDVTLRQSPQESQRYTVVNRLIKLQSEIEEELKSVNTNILRQFAGLHVVQERFEGMQSIKKMWNFFGIEESVPRNCLRASQTQAGEDHNSERTEPVSVRENILLEPVTSLEPLKPLELVKPSLIQRICMDRNLHITDLDLSIDLQGNEAINLNEVDILGWSPLHYAVILPDEITSKTKIQALLRLGADPNKPDIAGQTPLHRAIAITTSRPIGGQSDLKVPHSMRNMGRIGAMVRGGADVNRCARNGKSSLHFAAERGNSAVVKFLLCVGAAMDIRDHFRQTPLHLAAFEGYKLVVGALLEKGAYSGARDQEGRTPLHLAIMAGHCEIVKQLLVGMDVEDIMDRPRMKFGGSLMDALAIGGKSHLLYEILKLLADKKFVIDEHYAARAYRYAVEWNKSELVGAWLQVNCDDSSAMAKARCSSDEDGLNALHLASAQGHYDLLRLLILQGNIDLQKKTNSGDTALHWAVRPSGRDRQSDSRNNIGIVRTLLEAGTDVHAQNELGETVLHVAAEHQAPCSLVHVLLDAGSTEDVDLKTKSGNTALHLAVHYGHQDRVKVLLNAGSDVQVANKLGETAIHIAATVHNDRTLLQELLKVTGGSAAVAMQCQSGDTALHLAVRYANNEVAQEILAHGLEARIDFNTKNNSGETALHMAAVYANAPIIHGLLGARIDMNITNNAGATALQVAMQAKSWTSWSVAWELDRLASAAPPAGPTIFLSPGARVLYLTIKHSPAAGYEDLQHLLQDATVVGTDTDTVMDPGIMINGLVEGVRGWTALHTATAYGHTAIVNLLVKHGAGRLAFQRAADGRIALHIAAAYGYLEILKSLINIVHQNQPMAISPDPHGRRSGYESSNYGASDRKLEHMMINDALGWNALHTAAAHGQRCVIETLLEATRPIAPTNKTKTWTPPEGVAMDTDTVYVNAPIALRSVTNTQRPKHNVTALHLAALQGHADVVQKLLECHAVVNEPIDRSRGLTVNSGSNGLDRLTFNGISVLHAAVLGGNHEVVEKLLAQGAEVNLVAGALDLEDIGQMDHEQLFESSYWVMRKDGYTPLHLAAAAVSHVQAHTTSTIDIVKALLSKDADVNASTPCGLTALNCAVRSGREDIVRLLREYDAGGSAVADSLRNATNIS